jgi:hypothetical protein
MVDWLIIEFGELIAAKDFWTKFLALFLFAPPGHVFKQWLKIRKVTEDPKIFEPWTPSITRNKSVRRIKFFLIALFLLALAAFFSILHFKASFPVVSEDIPIVINNDVRVSFYISVILIALTLAAYVYSEIIVSGLSASE